MPEWPLSEKFRPDPKQYTCGHCGSKVGTDEGWVPVNAEESIIYQIYICTYCKLPTFFDRGNQVPAKMFGRGVRHVPEEVKELYNEARRCMTVHAYTASVLACRKILMNIAVGLGAPEGKRFIRYVKYLAETGYIPPNGHHWVDHIRDKGNEATHEIEPMDQIDAIQLLSLVEALLIFVYELPNRVPAPETEA